MDERTGVRMIRTDFTEEEIIERETQRVALLSEVSRLRRFIEEEHEDTERYKKQNDDLKKSLEKASILISNYRKLFEIMKTDQKKEIQ